VISEWKQYHLNLMEQKVTANIGQGVSILVRQLLTSKPSSKYNTTFRNLGVSWNKFASVWCTYVQQDLQSNACSWCSFI